MPNYWVNSVELTRAQLEAISTWASKQAGRAQHLGAIAIEDSTTKTLTESWNFFRELASTAAGAIGFESWMADTKVLSSLETVCADTGMTLCSVCGRPLAGAHVPGERSEGPYGLPAHDSCTP